MFSGFDNMTYTRKYSKSHQKIDGTCDFEIIPADNFKIEIPINKISATYNKDGMVNCLRPVPRRYPNGTFLSVRPDTRSWHGSLMAV